MLLEIDSLTVGYGGAPAIFDVALQVGEREIVSVIGPNGAGKSTLINTIAGLLRAERGNLRLAGTDLLRVPSHQVCRYGIALVPEGRRLFAGMTVEENLEIGCYRAGVRKDRDRSLERVYGFFSALHEKRQQLAGTLSGGQQQMVAIGRALMAGPKLLLLDEPSIGLAPAIVQTIGRIIRTISESGVDVLLVEQNAHMALSLSVDAFVLETGRIVMQGAAADLARSEAVRESYLGM
jgi:branched-chain amino acid transport system ATP-binding protein